MKRSLSRSLVLGLSLAALSAAGLAVAQPSESVPSRLEDPVLELRVVRFWAPSANVTEVLAMVGVPFLLTSPTGTGPAARVAYKVTMRIMDDRGTELAMDSMTRRAPASYRRPGAVGQESLNFPVTPGKYYLSVTVTDSVSGRVVRDSVAFDGYTEAPAASDLLLANSMRADTSLNPTVQANEIARGAFAMVANSETRIDLTRPSVAFMMEVYSKTATEAKLSMSLLTIAGEPVLQITPVKYQVPEKGRVIAQELPLEGLPQGRYLLEAELAVAGKPTVRRQATFTVTDPEIALQRAMEEKRAAMRTDEGYFNQLPADSLDTAAEVLVLKTKNADDLKAWSKDLPEIAKRNFLIKFWSNRNPNKAAGAENLDRIQFYQEVAAVNRMFTERNIPGWRTDRGRLWIRYGVPDDSTYYNGGTGAPILMWKWLKGKPAWVVFADVTRTKIYTVMQFSNNDEPGNLNWKNIVTPATIQAVVEPFTGVRFVTAPGDAGGGGGGGSKQ